jgi:hypothetical protein
MERTWMSPHPARLVVPLFLAACLSIPLPLSAQALPPPVPRPYGAFAFADSVTVSLSPGEAFDRFIDVNEWWDHRIDPSSSRFYIEARPGGGFFEIFDESGNGVRHATVILVKRGETLRMRGPLGLTGFALDMVYTIRFQDVGDGTRVTLDVRGAGELEEEWPALVQRVWHHFLVERYRPYAQGRLDVGKDAREGRR